MTIDTTHDNIHFLNQMNGKIPRSGVIDQQRIIPHELCYQCSKDGQDFYLSSWGLGIVDMNHAFMQKEKYYHFKSKWIICLKIMMDKK